MASKFRYDKNEKNQETFQKFEHLLRTLPRGDGWYTEHLFHYEGFWLGEPGLLGLLLCQDGHFNPRPQDIFLATSPKCGTTWTRVLIFATVNRKSYDSSTNPLLRVPPRDLVPMFEIHLSLDESASPLEAYPSPRLLATHLPYPLVSDSVKASGCRFVYVCRNPKDAFVSKWHFMQKVRPKELQTLSLEHAFELFCDGVSHYGPFWDHVLSYWKVSQETPDKVLFLMYEDLKRDPLAQVKKLAQFLGVPFSPEEEREGVAEAIVKQCSFEILSNLEVNKDSSGNRFMKNSDFFRKGEVGDWKNLLTPSMAARIDQITKENFQGSGLTFPAMFS